MAYLVLARKWRPTVFDDVVGQQHITQTLKNAVEQDRVPHALMFSGSRGIGKTSCARILAKALNCEQGPTSTPCGVCSPCTDITSGRSIDVFEIDGASNNSVEQIREIRESVKFVPTTGRRKVYIIDEVHMLSVSAFNALLKTLEEPPEHVLFIFATTEPHKIPETILSRCQRFDFRRISEGQIVGALKRIAVEESIEVRESVLLDIAREARGGMRDSLSLLDQVISFCGQTVDSDKARQVLGIAGRAQLSQMFGAICARDGQQVLELLEQQHQCGTDLDKYAHRFVDFLRDLLVVRICPQPDRLLDQEGEELNRMLALVRELEPADLHRMLGTVLRHVDDMSRSSFPKLRLEMALLEVCEQGPTLPIVELLDAIGQLTITPDTEVMRTSADKKKRTNEPDSHPEPGPSPQPHGEQPSVNQSLPERKLPVESVPKADAARSDLPSQPADPGAKPPIAENTVIEARASLTNKTPPPAEPKTEGTKKLSVDTKPEMASGQKAYKKRPSKRDGGYDDFSAFPPTPWASAECPVLTVKPRRRGGPTGVEESSDESMEAQVSSSIVTVSLADFCTESASAIERYGSLLSSLRTVDTFLASDLEQNSHAIRFDADQIEVAIEQSETELVRRAMEAFTKLLGARESLEKQILWTFCDRQDARLSSESIYDRRQKEAAARLEQRKITAEEHESVRLAKDILGGQVLDILPR